MRMRAMKRGVVLALLIGIAGLPVALVARGTTQPPTPALTETVEQQ